jgi:hypothetical protein
MDKQILRWADIEALANELVKSHLQLIILETEYHASADPLLATQVWTRVEKVSQEASRAREELWKGTNHSIELYDASLHEAYRKIIECEDKG